MGDGTRVIPISKGWLQVILAVCGVVVTVGVAWGSLSTRFHAVEKTQAEQKQTDKAVLERVHTIERKQDVMDVRQQAIAKGVDEIKAALAKPK